MEGKMNSYHIGIDLGTTYSCVGIWRPAASGDTHESGFVEVLANEFAHRTTASVVSFKQDSCVVGDAAKRSMASNPKNTIHAVKRIMGKRYNDPTVSEHLNDYSYDVIDHEGRAACEIQYQGRSQIFLPEEISAKIVSKMKELAENNRGNIASVVITVPAYFTDPQRAATRKAGEIAGLNVSQIINEPTAAAIAYGVQKRKAGKIDLTQTLLVYDLGGGTFDVSILKTDGQAFTAIAHGGDTFLGGEDFDNLLMNHLVEMFKAENGDDVDVSENSKLRLRKECEELKKTLSGDGVHEADVDIAMFYEDLDLAYTVTRAEFEKICDCLFQKTIAQVEQVLQDASLQKNDIDEILLVGGSTKIPRVREIVQEYFLGKRILSDINEAEAIAVGATMHAASLAGVQPAEGDESGIIELQDCTAHSLGIEVLGKFMSVVVKKGSKLPTSGSRKYTNLERSDRLRLCVFQGEKELTSNNTFLDKFSIIGNKIVEKDEMDVLVTFNISEEGLLSVSAVERALGMDKTVTITRSIWY